MIITRSINEQKRFNRPIMFSRSMFKASESLPASRGLVNTAYNGLTRTSNTPYMHRPTVTRNYACAHSGSFKPFRKPLVSDIDVSGKHKVVVVTECNTAECKTKNCADPSSNITCPNRTATQNISTIPSGANFKTEARWNFTSTPPVNKQVVKVDTHNYIGQQKDQFAVKETNPPQINSKDFTIDQQSTNYAQEQLHHEILTK